MNLAQGLKVADTEWDWLRWLVNLHTHLMGVSKELLLYIVAAHKWLHMHFRSYILVTLVPGPSQHLLRGEAEQGYLFASSPGPRVNIWFLDVCTWEPGVSWDRLPVCPQVPEFDTIRHSRGQEKVIGVRTMGNIPRSLSSGTLTTLVILKLQQL